LCVVWTLAVVVHTAFADRTIGGADTLKLRAWVTGAFFELAFNWQTLCGNAGFATHVDAFESRWAVVVVFASASTDFFARRGRLVEVELDAQGVVLNTIRVVRAGLAQACKTGVGRVSRLTNIRDTDLAFATIEVVKTVHCGRDVDIHIDRRVLTVGVAGGLPPALVPTFPRIAVGFADFVVAAVVVTTFCVVRNNQTTREVEDGEC